MFYCIYLVISYILKKKQENINNQKNFIEQNIHTLQDNDFGNIDLNNPYLNEN